LEIDDDRQAVFHDKNVFGAKLGADRAAFAPRFEDDDFGQRSFAFI
jgi:hypothetical protein